MARSGNIRLGDNAAGWLNGFIGVLIFSGSLPATRVAVQAFDPWFLTGARASLAGLLALLLLWRCKPPLPAGRQWAALFIVALGVVLGFPLLTALALQHLTSAHSIMWLGLLPLATAGFAVLRGGERPKPAFWCFALLGSLLVVGFAATQGLQASPRGDLLMLLAVAVCGLGYAEGARLSRSLGGWQVICWALLLALPVMAVLAAARAPTSLAGVAAPAWWGLGYVSLFSMLLGFVFWYRGLSLGGTAAVGQLQLLQPLFGLLLAGALLGEHVTAGMFGATMAVALCVAGARRFAG
ncbi:DMT family transporter [Pseudomonas typographi]|uniref:DMT family transporter n=1 Tax=Pseudomonas typographi TaxID=2715964 RepID=A0ABR7YYY9_9PSED|nr:DMT family transporter [Pseudomonas typographi]MBD1550861.1 DMT family transporter [Pseudomonas typographi]MBD1587803.1 DMT family transporter [Pseudomonas typographi]MBD1598326.1 DMT family transporter [Pseudomonas typographi]